MAAGKRGPRSPRSSAAPAKNHFPLVGIGASAGGLEAFKRLLDPLPTNTGMAFVLVQHLAPSHESMLPEILSRETAMPVVQVEHGMRVEPNRVFVIPPNASMELSDGTFKIAPRAAGDGPPLPIDCFFESLAEIKKATAIGVVLSGNASDGALGLRAIKAEGGITFAQDEASAKFAGMPHAAIASGSVDFVLPPEEIAKELDRIARHPHVVPRGKDKEDLAPEESGQDLLRRIFGMVRGAKGVDFSDYRPSTIRRRLSRRLVVNRIPNLGEYFAYLKKNPSELSALYDDFLITVTSFFREPETFEYLQKKICPQLFQGRSGEMPVRVWVPGCSTGEEAYSLAICLLECMDERAAIPLQVFATDVNEKAIVRARAGVYHESALKGVSPDRLRRFFVRVDGRFQVAKPVRDVCVFARQNIGTDPPFTNLDLLSCRNLLIYLDAPLQKRVLPLFHHALKPKGYLILGPSESVGGFSDLFAPMDKRHRIFVKRSAAVRPIFEFGRTHLGEPSGLPREKHPGQSAREVDRSRDLQRETDRMLLSRYAPPGVVINSAMEIVEFRGRTDAFLEGGSGAASLNILRMAKEGLLPDLRAAIHKAKSRNERVRKEGVRIKQDGSRREIDLEVLPLSSDGPEGRHYLVLFETAGRVGEVARPSSSAGRRQRKKAAASRAEETELEKLRLELLSTKEYLQTTTEEQETTNEELKTANEEILSSNEELQSTNEELDTAKEELESSNEELTTLNEELRNRNVELGRVNDDLVNLLASVQIPIVMVNSQGSIRRFTPAAEKLLNLIPSDVGRPIQNIRSNLNAPDLGELASGAMESLAVQTREVQGTDGSWHLLRVHPYRTLEDKIDGALLVFLDIDAVRKSFEEMPVPLLVLDSELRVQRANRAFCETFHVSQPETQGQLFYELGNRQWDVAALRHRLEEIIPKDETIESFEIEHDFEKIGHRVMLLSARQTRLAGEKTALILLAIDDVTEIRRAENVIQASEKSYRELFESAEEGILILDPETAEIRDVNAYLTKSLGVSKKDFLGKKLWDLPFVTGSEGLRRSLAEAKPGHTALVGDVRLTSSAGRTILMEAMTSLVSPGDQTQLSLKDVTERRRLEEELRQIQKMESIGRLAGGMAHDFNNILNIISVLTESLERPVSDPGKREKNIRAIRKTVERGAGVVRQILTFARRDESTFGQVNLNEVVEEVGAIVSGTFPKNIAFSADLASDLPAIKADSNQLHQALLNLCVNARDAMEKGGSLRISTKPAQPREVRGRFPEASAWGYARVEITDSGTGMDEETRMRVFEPFFTTKRRGEGSGMGLAVVYGVVSAHRGFVDLESEEGKGTRVVLYFPVPSAQVGDARAAAAAEPQVLRGSETILLVEDEELLLDSVKELLEREGYRVLKARDGIEAVRIYRGHFRDIALVVSDLELPKLSGWEAFEKMRRIHPEVRIVLVSGYLDPTLRASMTDRGAKAFLRKPYTGADILTTIREVLDRAGEPGRSGKDRQRRKGAARRGNTKPRGKTTRPEAS